MKLWDSAWWTKTEAAAPAAALLSFPDLASLGLGCSLGFAISVLLGHLLKDVAGPAAVVSISLAGATALVAGLCFAEFGVRLLKADSAYAYSYLWANESAAFVFGWALLVQYVAGTASGARGVIAFIDSLTEGLVSDFLKSVASLDDCVFPYVDFLSLAIVAAITILIAFGMKDSVTVKKIFTTCNILLIITVIAAGSFRVDPKNWRPEGPQEDELHPNFTPFGILGVAKGAAIAFYGFIGFDTVSITGNEVRKRKRNIPLVITTTVTLTLLAFAGVATVLTLMLPYHEHDPHAAVPFAFQQVGWTTLKWVVAVGTFCGFQTSLFGAAFSVPRIIHAMANDGLLFHCLGNSHSKLRIPVAASAAGGLLSAAAAGFFSFEELVDLTVMGALLAFTILAVGIILLRYSPRSDVSEEHLSESWSQLINTNSEISVKAVLKNFFNFSAKTPSNLTKRIILTNIILFCICSIGIGIIFSLFHEPLVTCALEAVIPAGILLSVLCLSVVSMMCQPKSQENAPFKVPLVPLLPCLSIFLNIFLMLTFESLTFIFFFGWMAVGIVPYCAWLFLKYLKEDLGDNSLYEINKSNAVKLSDSIWKIKSEKKSFYEGAVNPVFSDDLEEPSKATDANSETNEGYEKSSLRQVDAIRKAEAVEEEKPKSAGSEMELRFFYAENAEIGSSLPEEEKVQWECVAEIHTEEEFPQENIALEIVDNTYNFLSELSREDGLQGSGSKGRSEDSNPSSRGSPYGRETPESAVENTASEENGEATEKSKHPQGNGHLLMREELLSKIQERMERRKKDEFSDEAENDKSKSVVGISQTSGENDRNEEIASNSERNSVKPEGQGGPRLPEEQNKVKEFKEKLNQLLKNQINNGEGVTKNTPMSKPNVGVDADAEEDLKDENDANILRNSIKTLNKSQIKSKLELLLTKGPPKRPSLGSSFNIKIKETDKETQKSEEEFLNSEKDEGLNSQDGEEKFQKLTTDPSAKAEKIFSLENKDLPNDVCC